MTAPAVADFTAYFTRDFPYGTDPATSILDGDITKALLQASVNINEELWPTQELYSMAYLYLAAHYLVVDLRAASQGISGTYSWMTTNKAVGSVSEGFQVPQKIMDNPYLAMLAKTSYGAKYLEMALPQLVGNVFVSCGATTP